MYRLYMVQTITMRFFRLANFMHLRYAYRYFSLFDKCADLLIVNYKSANKLVPAARLEFSLLENIETSA